MKKNTGSSLVFSLVVLSIISIIALGAISVTVINKKMAISTDRSSQAFQAATSGTEAFLAKIKGKTGSLSSLGVCNLSGSVGSGTYTVQAYRENGTSPVGCDTNVSEIDHIRSVGKYDRTTRAVEIAVAAGCCEWVRFPEGEQTSGQNYGTAYLYLDYGSGEENAYKSGATGSCFVENQNEVWLFGTLANNNWAGGISDCSARHQPCKVGCQIVDKNTAVSTNVWYSSMGREAYYYACGKCNS